MRFRKHVFYKNEKIYNEAIVAVAVVVTHFYLSDTQIGRSFVRFDDGIYLL